MKPLQLLIILGSLAGFSSCYFEGSPFRGITGQGPVVERKLELDPIKGISIPGSAKIRLTQGENQEVRVEGQENIIDNLNLAVTGDIWRIEGKQPVWQAEPLIIHITMETLRMVKISGSGTVTALNQFNDLRELELNISGSGSIDLDIAAREVKGNISGSGTIILKGSADKIELGVSGSGGLQGSQFKTEEASLRISGSGNMELAVSERLDANISGSGSIFYYGNPRVDSRVSGSGRIKSR